MALTDTYLAKRSKGGELRVMSSLQVLGRC